MIMGWPKPKPSIEAMAAARAAAEEIARRAAADAARARLDAFAEQLDADAAERHRQLAHHSGAGCARCGATHPPQGWCAAGGVDGLPAVCCAPCADPTAGPGEYGWSRPVMQDWEIRGLLLSRVLGLPVDVPWLAAWGRQRYGLRFNYADDASLPQVAERAPWSHIDLDPWRPVGERAARRQRAFGAPLVPGLVIDGVDVDETRRAKAQREAAQLAAMNSGQRVWPGGVPWGPLPEWTAEQLDQAEEQAVTARLAELDAEELAVAARVAERADRDDRSRVKAVLDRQFRAEQRQREREHRRRIAAA
jgi:hypothetical protein